MPPLFYDFANSLFSPLLNLIALPPAPKSFPAGGKTSPVTLDVTGGQKEEAHIDSVASLWVENDGQLYAFFRKCQEVFAVLTKNIKVRSRKYHNEKVL